MGTKETCPDILHIPSYLEVENKRLKVVCIKFSTTLRRSDHDVCCKIIHIPETIKKIDFSFNRNISEVYFPKSLEQNISFNFIECSNLMKIHLPNKLQTINESAFYDCPNLKEIISENKNLTFEANTFAGCKKLNHITDDFCIENGLLYNKKKTKLYTYLGNNDSNKNLILPNTVCEIVEKFGEGLCLSNYESIDMSQTKIRVIKFGTFSNCDSLQRIILPLNLIAIENCAFFECTNLKYINFPDSIKSIGDSSFYGCAFYKIVLPNQLERVSHGLFENCDKLVEVTIPLSVKSISGSAFSGCHSLKKVIISEVYKRHIYNLFENANNINFIYIFPQPTFTRNQTGAFTHGRLRPCPYCGSNNVNTFSDGTAECENCGGEYRYAY